MKEKNEKLVVLRWIVAWVTLRCYIPRCCRRKLWQFRLVRIALVALLGFHSLEIPYLSFRMRTLTWSFTCFASRIQLNMLIEKILQMNFSWPFGFECHIGQTQVLTRPHWTKWSVSISKQICQKINPNAKRHNQYQNPKHHRLKNQDETIYVAFSILSYYSTRNPFFILFSALISALLFFSYHFVIVVCLFTWIILHLAGVSTVCLCLCFMFRATQHNV